MEFDDLLRDMRKIKMQATDLYLLALRQILINQSELLRDSRSAYGYQHAEESKKLAIRITEFIENGE